jgi:hypothetical protein
MLMLDCAVPGSCIGTTTGYKLLPALNAKLVLCLHVVLLLPACLFLHPICCNRVEEQE